jgi:acetyl esterase/lipase
MRITTTVRLYRIAILVMCLESIDLHAQTTSPLDLLKEGAAPGERISYGSGDLQFGELRVPAGTGTHPLVILVHGGCWQARIGKLPEAATSLDLLRPMALALAGEGIASWNVEYRRLGQQGGGWPGTFEDVGNAIDFVRTLAPKYSLDPQRIAIVGHSSGGHLATWAAGRHKLPADSTLRTAAPLRVAGVVVVDGPLDLEAFIAIEQQVCGGPVVEQLLGGGPASLTARYREASATGLLPIVAKQELLIASKANESWIGAIRSYAATAEQAGDKVVVTMMENSGHFDGLNPKAPAWATVLASLRSIIGPK